MGMVDEGERRCGSGARVAVSWEKSHGHKPSPRGGVATTQEIVRTTSASSLSELSDLEPSGTFGQKAFPKTSNLFHRRRRKKEKLGGQKGGKNLIKND